MELLRFTILTYSIFITSLILFALGTCQIALEARLLNAFRSITIQYPGSSLAEWKFVNMSPGNIDSGPTIANFAVGACSLCCSLLGMIWIVTSWWGIIRTKDKRLPVMTGIASIISTAITLGFVVYVFVTEAQQKLPEYFRRWQSLTFTREFYVCDAFPSIFEDSDALYGFDACSVAKAARYELVAICCVLVVLAALTVFQAQRNGNLRLFEENDGEDERTLPNKKTFPNTNVLRSVRLASKQPQTVHTTDMPPRSGAIQMPSICARSERPSIHEYYAKA